MKRTEIEWMPIGCIKPYDRNPRRNDGAVEALAKSITEFGFKNPIIVDKDLVIIAGHTRLKAAKLLGLKEVPVVVASDLSEAQTRAYRLADNKIGELAEWDDDLLQEELDALEDEFDMEDFGFEAEIADDAQVMEGISEPPIPDVPEEPISKPGDVWKCGDHMVMCGDATNPHEMARLMDGELADLAVTDPPYNVDYTGKTADALKIENDRMEESRFVEFLSDAFRTMAENMRGGGAFYIWHADSEGRAFREAVDMSGLDLKQCLIWVKNSLVLGRQDYQWIHEPCLYGWKPGASHYFTDDRSLVTVMEQEPMDLSKLKKEELLDLVMRIFDAKVPTTVIRENRPTRSDLHPTMKPVKLMARLISNSSQRGEIVLDPFGGSGSTLLACESLGRRCRTMELDPRYCDVIIKRWEEQTGKKAVLT